MYEPKKLKQAKSNFSKIEFHKPTRNMSGSGIQITANLDGSLNFQIAKQATPHNGKQDAATYSWTDKDKNIMFILSADELRDVCELLKKVLSNKARLFIMNQHKTVVSQNQDPGYDNAYFYHSPLSKNDKSILFFGKEYNNQLQVEMRVYEKKKNLTLMFSFSEKEVKKLLSIFATHAPKELEIPNGYKSVVTDEKGNIIRECILPPYNKGDIMVISSKEGDIKYEIFYKSHIFSKNLTHYAIKPFKK